MSLDPLFHTSLVIQVHVVAAVLAFLIGAIQLYRRKGDRLHRFFGSTWVALMAIVALSSFMIWTIRLVGPFSPIHLVSIFVLVMLWYGVTSARRHDIGRHSRTMRLTYLLGLVITGLLTFIPGRTMYRVAFGEDGATPQKLIVFGTIVVVAAIAALVVAIIRTRQLQQEATPAE